MPRPNLKNWFQKYSFRRRKDGKAPGMGEESVERVEEGFSSPSTASSQVSALALVSMAGQTPSTPSPSVAEEQLRLQVSAQTFADMPPTPSRATNAAETTIASLEPPSASVHGAITNLSQTMNDAGGHATVEPVEKTLRDCRAVEERGNPDPLGGAMPLNFTQAQVQVHGSGGINSGTVTDPSGKRYEAAKWLYSFTPDQRQIWSSFLDLRLLGTGGHVLAAPEFKEWENGEKTYLECTGMPGAGKSMAAAIVVDHLQHRWNSPTVLSFFCENNATWSHSIDRVLANLLGQLVRSRSNISKSTSALYHEYQPLPNIVPPVGTIFNALKSELSSSSDDVFIVVDALDEFSPANDGRHLHLIEQLEKLHVPVMITSRKPVPFSNALPARMRLHANEEDILNYIQDSTPVNTNRRESTMSDLQATSASSTPVNTTPREPTTSESMFRQPATGSTNIGRLSPRSNIVPAGVQFSANNANINGRDIGSYNNNQVQFTVIDNTSLRGSLIIGGAIVIHGVMTRTTTTSHVVPTLPSHPSEERPLITTHISSVVTGPTRSCTCPQSDVTSPNFSTSIIHPDPLKAKSYSRGGHWSSELQYPQIFPNAATSIYHPVLLCGRHTKLSLFSILFLTSLNLFAASL